jgi:aliphatic nitrilase
VLEQTPVAASFFLDPTGAPIGDERVEEGLAYAELDLGACIEPKRFHDVAAGYNRFDVFDLTVHRRRLEPVSFHDLTVAEPASAPSEEIEDRRSPLRIAVGD